MNARMRRIASDYEQIQKNFSNHKNIAVEPIGEAPAEKYRVTYYINGINLLEDGRIETISKHIVIITLHAEYPRYKPICTIATPIWHPNFRDGQICIGDIWGAGESLSDIIVNIGDMIQYKSWNSFSPLSADAAEWAIANKHLFPVGNIDLWTGEELDGSTAGDVDIDVFDESTEDASFGSGLEYPGDVSGSMSNESPSFDSFQDFQSKGTQVFNPDSDNDFEITAEELVGIEFVPTAERMQTSRYGASAKGGKVNFKTILIKGLLWALIGAFVGFGFSEVFDGITSEATVADILGYSNLSDFYEYNEKSNDAIEEVNDDFMDYCEENGLDSDDQYVLQTWLSQNYDKYADKMDEYSTYNDKASQAFYYAYEDEFDGDEDDIKATMDNIQRISTGLWSGLIALFIGLFLGLGEGIYYGSFEKAVIYALIGAGISILIGTISGYCAQWMYASLLSEDSSDIVKALVRALGWAIMGVGVGLSVGLIKPDANRIAFCTLGGVIGAFVGGFLFNYIFELVPHDIVARGIAIVIMGLLIGVGVGLLEQFAKSAWLKVIRGEFEGKEYLVFKGVTSIGNSGKNMVVLFKDKLVAPNHCDIVQEGSKYVLVDKGSPMGTVVNGMRINRHVLRAGDAISIGNSVLIFNTK